VDVAVKQQNFSKLEPTLRDAKLVSEKLKSLLTRLVSIPKYHLAETEKKLRKQRESKLRKEGHTLEISLDQVAKDVSRVIRHETQVISVVSETEDDEEDDESYTRQTQQLHYRTQEAINNEIDHIAAISKDRLITVHSVERQALEIRDAMRELHEMVHQQQPLLDIIESRIEVTLNDVKGGVEDITKAEGLQQKKRKRLCCIAMMLTIGLLVFVLFLIAMLHT